MDIDWTNFCYEKTETDWDSYYEHLAEVEDSKWEDNNGED